MRLPLQQLSHFYHHAFDWLDHNLELFNPLNNAQASPASNLYQAKALGELGLLCMLYYRHAQGQHDPRIERFLRLIHTVWQQAGYKERIIRKPEHFQIYAMIYVVLQQCHMLDDTERELIQRVIDQGYATAIETTPMRLLDRRHLLDCGSFHHTLPSYKEIYAGTLLAKTPPPVYLTDVDVYAITHTLFYLTDFGSRPMTMFDEEHLARVRWLVEVLLGIYVRRMHWDLVGELLFNCYCMHWYPDVTFDTSWEILIQAQLPDGSVPGPRFSTEHLSQLQDTEKSEYCFEHNYHTTIVTAITAFLTRTE